MYVVWRSVVLGVKFVSIRVKVKALRGKALLLLNIHSPPPPPLSLSLYPPYLPQDHRSRAISEH